MRTSFRNSLLLFIVGLLAVTLASSLLAVMRASTNAVEDLVRAELGVVERVFRSLLQDDREQLRNRAELLAGDFAFKRAIATGEEATMLSALANHGERINADFVVMLSRSGEVLLSTHPVARLPASAAALVASGSRQAAAILTLFDGQTFQLVLVPVLAPDLLGWVGLATAVDGSMLEELRAITNADITLVAHAAGRGARVLESTLSPALTAGLQAGDSSSGVASRLAESLAEAGWLSRDVDLLREEGQEVVAVLSQSLEQALNNYRPLRQQMLIIGFVALGLAGFTALVIARSVTQPIYALVDAARRITDGNYSRRIELAVGEEFGMLADTLNLMQDTVSEREARIRHQAQHDMLTQLPNRYYINSVFNSRMNESPQRNQFGMGLLELENLQQLTDLYGSEFSDAVLQQIAERISTSLRRGDIAARVADSQILLFFEDLTHAGVEAVVQKLRDDFTAPLLIGGVPVRLEPLLGFVFAPQHGQRFDELVRRAQIALGTARSASGGWSVYRIGQDEVHLRQITLAHRLQAAVDAENFTVFYQPKYDLHAHRVLQVEALMRWTDTELGAVYPDEFIPVAEQTGIITAISVIVLKQVLGQLQDWQGAGIELTACVNLSGADILQAGFVRHVIDSLQASGLDSSALVIEVTETMMMADMDVALANIREFEEAGICLAIDDFGTGFSSLAQLKMLPVQELKIDKSLILNLDRDGDDQKIVRSTIEMAHYLGLKVVAEGVENLASLHMLQDMGCDSVQGYYLARPMTASALQSWLAAPPPEVRAISEERYA
ncbi:MAG: EAL domain-containing protein [Haliea sp.]|uniref:putative bifunctional diguanylate cyclase/phosphodiesterase n=1 Tax=Haliea sp. TaxID=1932666 RepID=UPI0032EAD92B